MRATRYNQINRRNQTNNVITKVRNIEDLYTTVHFKTVKGKRVPLPTTTIPVNIIQSYKKPVLNNLVSGESLETEKILHSDKKRFVFSTIQ